MARLILNPGKSDEAAVALHQGRNTIGRTKNNDVFVLHKSLSRQHACLVLDGERAEIEDLGSKNGTFVDGVRVEKHAFEGPHAIKLGDVELAFLPEGASLPQASAKPSGAPTLVYDVSADPARRSLEQMLAKGKGSVMATALALPPIPDEDRAGAKLQILLKVSELLSSPAPIDEVLSRILDLAFEILHVDRAAIVMADDDTLEPRITKVRPGLDATASFSRQIVHYVLDQGVAALFADTQSDPRLADGRSILAQSICASMCAPLRPRDRLLGALYVDNLARPEQFTSEDLEFLSAFANQAAIAIDNAMLSTRLAQEAVSRNNLLRFFPPTAIEAIIQGGGEVAAIETEATVLFSDISGFTALSSSRAPGEVIAMLNAYFPVMADIVFRHEGTLEKYIGDALLAVWGAPFSHPDDAARAVRAAVDMQRVMADLGQREPLLRGLTIHIGVNSGIVAAGNIGSQHYLQYATIGDATNVASRICNVAGAGEIVVDEGTAGRLGGEWPLEPLEPVRVKGKDQPLSLRRVSWE